MRAVVDDYFRQRNESVRIVDPVSNAGGLASAQTAAALNVSSRPGRRIMKGGGSESGFLGFPQCDRALPEPAHDGGRADQPKRARAVPARAGNRQDGYRFSIALIVRCVESQRSCDVL